MSVRHPNHFLIVIPSSKLLRAHLSLSRFSVVTGRRVLSTLRIKILSVHVLQLTEFRKNWNGIPRIFGGPGGGVRGREYPKPNNHPTIHMQYTTRMSYFFKTVTVDYTNWTRGAPNRH